MKRARRGGLRRWSSTGRLVPGPRFTSTFLLPHLVPPCIRTYDRTVTTTATTSGWYADACRRARAHGRRRRAAQASTEWPEFAPPVALSDGPLGAVQSADREIGRQMAVRAPGGAGVAATPPAPPRPAPGEPGGGSPERGD